jgi:putative transposon-encoded protein
MSKTMIGEEFEFTVQKCGNSGHVRLSNKWIGKRVRIKVEEIEFEIETQHQKGSKK